MVFDFYSRNFVVNHNQTQSRTVTKVPAQQVQAANNLATKTPVERSAAASKEKRIRKDINNHDVTN